MAESDKRIDPEIQRDIAVDAALRAKAREVIALDAAQTEAEKARAAEVQAGHEGTMRYAAEARAEASADDAATSKAGVYALTGVVITSLLLVAWWAWSSSGPDIAERDTATVNVMPAQPAPVQSAPPSRPVVVNPPAQPPIVIEKQAEPRQPIIVVTPPANTGTAQQGSQSGQSAPAGSNTGRDSGAGQ